MIIPSGRVEQFFIMAMMRNIPSEYGPVSCDGAELKFHGENKPPDAVLAMARQKAIEEVYSEEVRMEAQRRILIVMGDGFIQMEFLMWCVQHLNSDNGFMADDLRMAHSIMAWAHETRMASKRLIDDPTWHDDKHWPREPDGAREFMRRNF